MRCAELFENEVETRQRVWDNFTIVGKVYVDRRGIADIDGNCTLFQEMLNKIPIKLRQITGNFQCNSIRLTSLTNSPERVEGNFDAYENNLTSLVGASAYIGKSFSCFDNMLTNLIGAPSFVGGDFYCRRNPLTSLEGIPKELRGIFVGTWDKDLPVLRTLIAKRGVVFFGSVNVKPHPITDIINKYKGHTNLRHAILDLSRDLVAAGYAENAKW